MDKNKAMTPAGFARVESPREETWELILGDTVIAVEYGWDFNVPSWAKELQEERAEKLNAAASKAIENEREECAKLVESMGGKYTPHYHEVMAKAIRSRGK